MHPTGNLSLLDRMVTDGLITPEQRETVHSQTRLGERFEEILLERNAVDEGKLLKYLATLYKTRFVSTEKLARADIDRFTLDKVPAKLADAHTVFPVLFEPGPGILSIVTPDPDNQDSIREVQLVSGAKQVRAFLGRPRGVKAAIAKAYHGDIHSFAQLDRNAHEQFTNMLDIYERQLVSDESLTTSLASEAVSRERTIDGASLEKAANRRAGTSLGGGTGGNYLELLNVLVSLLENTRAELRGHSAHVARLMRKTAERLQLSEIQTVMLVIAAYVHDIGKMGTYHLTALNVAEYDGHRASAVKLARSPVRILETVELPEETVEAVSGMYERFDGKGFPDGARGRDIPLGARLLAIADTYADLTQNPRNPYRKALRPVQACEALAKYRGSVFDPNLIDLFQSTVTGDDLKARLLANRHLALIVDPDPEETTILELRMIEQGFEVRQARTADQALKLLSSGDIELVFAELDLGEHDGLKLLTEVRKQSWGDVPWIVVTGRTRREDAQEAFRLGAVDYVNKPVNPDVLVAKARQLLERHAGRKGARGVSGSLTEMGLPDMVQVLWHGRKSGSLKVTSARDAGEIHFVDGQIYNALWGTLRGEEAFYAMLKLVEGEFTMDPNFHAPQAVIQASPEALLLEGMRRLDEEGR
jgi:response regulator RpfG family c-di-GMP phosphodiesterase